MKCTFRSGPTILRTSSRFSSVSTFTTFKFFALPVHIPLTRKFADLHKTLVNSSVRLPPRRAYRTISSLRRETKAAPARVFRWRIPQDRRARRLLSRASAKGKGFQLRVKRWHYAGGDCDARLDVLTARRRHRRQFFSVACWKNQHFPGHMRERTGTAKKFEGCEGGYRRKLLLVRGSVPGPSGNVHFHRKARKSKVSQ